MADLNDLRNEIDEINDGITALLVKRMRLSEEIALAKRESGDAVYCPEREKQILDAVSARAGLYSGGARLVFAALMDASKERQRELRTLWEAKPAALIGMPGCGKTSIGKMLAETFLREEFIDTDAVFLKRYGLSAGECIRTHGEAEFRKAEAEILAEAVSKKGCVIATGGGAVVSEENRRLLKEKCIVYRIERDPALLPETGRPLSADKGIKALYEERKAWYEETACAVIDNGAGITEAAERIYEDLLTRLNIR